MTCSPTVHRSVPAAVLLLSLIAATARPQEISNRSIYLLANEIADDVELIREVMGRPYDDSPRLPASDVSMSELYFQAQTLFRKANQLAREMGVAEREAAAPAPIEGIEHADTFAVLEAAAVQVTRVKQALGIATEIEPLERESDISTTAIFMTIIDVNRQLNLMLDETIDPSDVFDQIALVNSYAAGIINQLSADGANASLEAPEAHRRPADVYSKLLECIEVVSRIARQVDGAEVMSLRSRRNIPDDIEPGHVYDIAQILVADVATIAIALNAVGFRLDLPAPERIFPTQVYQRAELLLEQLEAIDLLL